MVGNFFLGGSSLISGVTTPLDPGVVGTLMAAAALLRSSGVPSGRDNLIGFRGVNDAAEPESEGAYWPWTGGVNEVVVGINGRDGVDGAFDGCRLGGRLGGVGVGLTLGNGACGGAGEGPFS